MASHTMAVQKEMATTVRLSAYLKDAKSWGVAMGVGGRLGRGKRRESVFLGKIPLVWSDFSTVISRSQNLSG